MNVRALIKVTHPTGDIVFSNYETVADPDLAYQLAYDYALSPAHPYKNCEAKYIIFEFYDAVGVLHRYEGNE